MSKELLLYATSDLHVGNKEFGTTIECLQASLQEALDAGAAAYLIAGDFVDKGNIQDAQIVGRAIAPYTKRGLQVIGIVGNHDFQNGSSEEVSHALSGHGITMLEGESYVVSNGEKSATIIGISSEVGEDADDWWRIYGWDQVKRQEVVEKAVIHRDALRRELEKAQTEDIILLTHRSVISDTMGVHAKEKGYVPPQTEGFIPIINDSLRRGKRIQIIHGHHHDLTPNQQMQGQTLEGAVVHNVAAPVRRGSLAKKIVI